MNFNKWDYRREMVQMKDGVGSVDWRPQNRKDKPLVVIVPGVMSYIHDHYIHTMIDEMADDYDWVILNYNGVAHQLTTPIPFTANLNSTFKEDLRHVLN